MKVKYNHQQSFAHRFISHMEEVEAADLIRKSNNARQPKHSQSKQPYYSSKKKLDYIQNPMTPQQTKILTQFNHNRQSYPRNQHPQTRFADIEVGKKKVKQSDVISTERRQSKDVLDNLLSDFQYPEINNVSTLKESYLRLWYQRMALDNNHSVLLAQNKKKDDIINQLRQELGQKSGHHGPMFFNPHTPVHAHSQNKTAVLHNQSTSLQSHTVTNQQSSTGLGHWNSLHPNKNFNVGTTRSNA